MPEILLSQDGKVLNQVNNNLIDTGTKASDPIVIQSKNGIILAAPSGSAPSFSEPAGSLRGFYGATPVTQQTNPGNVATSAAAGATVLAGTSFTGGVGSRGYTVGDLVAALKNLGLIAS